MALSNITITRGSGNLGGVLASRDGDCGILHIDSRYSTPLGPVTIYSIKELENLGAGYSDSDLTNKGVLHFHVSQYFATSQSPLTICGVAADAAFDQIDTMQLYAGGNIRIYGVLDNVVQWAGGKLTAIQSRLDAIETAHTPAVAVYSADLASTVEVTPTDLTLLSAYRVASCLAEDVLAGSRSALLRAASSNNLVSSIGLCLGVISRSRVNDSIAWKGINDMGGFMGQAGFIDGSKVKDKTLSFLGTLDDKHHTFVINGPDSSGIFWNFDYTASPETNDYHTIALNRVYDKSYRLMYKALYPELSSTVYFNEDGSLSLNSINKFKALISTQLDEMLKAGEISAYTVYINPAQNVISTKTVDVVVTVVPTGVAKYITITSRYALSI